MLPWAERCHAVHATRSERSDSSLLVRTAGRCDAESKVTAAYREVQSKAGHVGHEFRGPRGLHLEPSWRSARPYRVFSAARTVRRSLAPDSLGYTAQPAVFPAKCRHDRPAHALVRSCRAEPKVRASVPFAPTTAVDVGAALPRLVAPRYSQACRRTCAALKVHDDNCCAATGRVEN